MEKTATFKISMLLKMEGKDWHENRLGSNWEKKLEERIELKNDFFLPFFQYPNSDFYERIQE